MAAFVLFVLAVAGGGVVADLVWKNPTAGQVTLFDHTVTGYREGWLLAIAAGLGCVVALLLGRLRALDEETTGGPQAAQRSAARTGGPGSGARARSWSPAGWVLRP